MPQTTAPGSVRPVAIAPTYNNADTLLGVLERIAALAIPIVVVNDGSSDATAARLETWTSEARRVAVDVVTHPHNRGKAAALRTGFARAVTLGYTHGVTIDTDGQLDPEDAPALLAVARREPTALVLGFRDPATHNGPARSMLGRRWSNLGIWLACGQRVHDSQCGMRVYPLELIQAVSCRGQCFAYETEVITRAAWAGCPIEQAPVNSRYFSPEQRVSHFRPVMDSIRGIGLHGRLLSRRLLPWPHRRVWPG